MYSLNFALKLAWRFSKLLLIYLDHTMIHDACTAAILAQEGWEEMFQSHMTRLAQIFLPSDFCCTCYFIQRSNGSSSVWHSHWTQQKGVQEKSTGIIQVSTSDVEFTLETKLALGCENFPLLFFQRLQLSLWRVARLFVEAGKFWLPILSYQMLPR